MMATDLAAPEEHPLIQKFRSGKYMPRAYGIPKEVADVVQFLASLMSAFLATNSTILSLDISFM
jgi:hypothetical protein